MACETENAAIAWIDDVPLDERRRLESLRLAVEAAPSQYVGGARADILELARSFEKYLLGEPQALDPAGAAAALSR